MTGVSCCVPVAPIRHEPSHKSEMVSQGLFGETADMIEEKDDWIRVKLHYDEYEGWVQQGQFSIDDINEKKISALLAPGWVQQINYHGQPMQIPMGASIPQGISNDFTPWDPSAHLPGCAAIRNRATAYLLHF